MKKHLRVGLAGASVLVLAGVLVGPSPAVAAAGNGACTSTETCAFRHSSYGGGLADIALADSNWTNNSFGNGGSANDAVSSGGNVDRAIRLYQHAGFSGHSFVLGVGTFDSLWTTQPRSTNGSFNFNDQVSSSSVYVPL